VSGWPTRRLKFLATINSDKLNDSTPADFAFRYIDISTVGRGRLTAEPEVLRFGDAPSRARRRVQPGDTIVSTVRTYLRAVWPVIPPTEDLVVSTAFAVLSPGDAVHPPYLGWCAQSDPFIEEVVARSTGVSYPAINPADLGDLEIPMPPLPAQRAVAAFLDKETVVIDSLVRKRQETLRLLAERRRATINREVMGFASIEPRRGTSIPWLSEIPASWEVRRLKFAATLQTGITLGKRYASDVPLVRRPYLRVANVQDGYLALDEITQIEIPAVDVPRYELKRGDVLVTEGGDYDKLGRGYVWGGEIQGCLHQNHVFAVRPIPELLEPVFLAHLMTSAHGRAYFTSTGQQTTNLASTNSTVLMDLPVPLPPLEDQRAILARLEPALRSIDRLTEMINSQVELLIERRRALITAAVMGVIDVQQVAA
jgi:type I restriction enzyme, S subunit